MKKPLVSIIFVNYKVKKELFNCLKSIEKYKSEIPIDVIVVDNDESPTIQAELKKEFPFVIYKKSSENIGFGAGNNFGAKDARGEYLFFLNPDTILYKNTIGSLLMFYKNNKKVGIVAPLLLNPKGQPYNLQGTKTLTPLRAIFGLSFLNKLFPNNPVSNGYWLKGWDKSKIKEVDVVPGTAFMISKKLFKQIGGFDEKFFLYFEEFDLCKRVKELGYKLFIIPQSKVLHLWGKSTKQSNKNIKKIFETSRFYYFKKNFGLINAVLIELFLRIKKEHLIFIIILIFGSFLRFFNVNQNKGFYAEVGDNLLDIKNAYVHHYIPLLGPPTSHPWLYFGPLFYWIYGPILILSKFNPLSHAYFGVVISILTIIANYLVISKIFNKKTGLISSFLISISPMYMIAVSVARFIYVVPFLIYPFLYLFYKIISEKKKYFFGTALVLGIMLNFHYSTLILIPFCITVLIIKKIPLDKNAIVESIIGFLLPQAPLVLYDSQHKFTMLKNLFLWFPYKVLIFLHLYHNTNLHSYTIDTSNITFLNFFLISFSSINERLLSLPGIIIFVVVLIFIALHISKFFKSKGTDLKWLFLILWCFWGLFSIFIQGSPPLHYFVPLFPLPILFFSLFLSDIWKRNKGKYIVLASLLLLLISNCLYFFSDKWFFQTGGIDYSTKQKIARIIVNDAKGKQFVLKRIGYNDFFPKQFAQDYIYLLWLDGNEPVNDSKLEYTIIEEANKIPKKIPSKAKLFVVNSNITVEKTVSE